MRTSKEGAAAEEIQVVEAGLAEGPEGNGTSGPAGASGAAEAVPASERANRGARVVKGVLGVVVALAFFALCNALISFVYEPYGSRSDVSWSDYSKMEDIDTVIVGTSLAQHAINPQILDEIVGSKSFNLATPSQSLEDSFVGIQTAYEDFGVKRAVLGLSRASTTASGPPNACSPYLHLRSKFVTFGQTFSAVNQMLWRYGASATETSINWMFPWIANHVKPSISNFKDTVQAKLSHADLVEACEHYDPGWKYIGRGHGTRGSVLNYDSSAAEPLADGEEGDEGATSSSASSVIDADRALTLRDIVEYCRAHDIELTIVSMPLPLFNVIDEQAGYFDLKHSIDEVCEELGVVHYDFNFATDELYKANPDYFYDSSHFNLKGARAFSKSFGKFLSKLEAGQDVESLFCSEEELVDSVEGISLLMADDEVDAAGIHLHARAIAGPAVQCEYQFCTQSADDPDSWDVVRDWSQDADFDYEPAARGETTFRVFARQVGASEPERYRTLTELF